MIQFIKQIEKPIIFNFFPIFFPISFQTIKNSGRGHFPFGVLPFFWFACHCPQVGLARRRAWARGRPDWRHVYTMQGALVMTELDRACEGWGATGGGQSCGLSGQANRPIPVSAAPPANQSPACVGPGRDKLGRPFHTARLPAWPSSPVFDLLLVLNNSQ